MNFLAVALIVGWIVCGTGAVWGIVETVDMWRTMPRWFALSFDVFLLFVAFALPAKIVILVAALSKRTSQS